MREKLHVCSKEIVLMLHLLKKHWKGAAYVIIDNSDYFIDNRTILVLDSLKAISQYHRTFFRLTHYCSGSIGKTTKRTCQSSCYEINEINGWELINHIGVPLAHFLLQMKPK
jgi:UDP-N-acetylmuramoyl-tripeptide--D-alanyl-D-alanine ligase